MKDGSGELDTCVEIALAADQNYFKGLLVTATSIASNAAREARLVFHVLDGGIDDESFAFLESAVLKGHANASVRRLKIDMTPFSAYPTLHGNLMTYVRFLLPRLIPSDFVIYCDVDFLCMADFCELWKLADADAVLLSTPDLNPTTLDRERSWCRSHGIGFRDGEYFCAGLSFMNLRKFREHRLDELCFKFLAENHDVNYHDQSALNFVIWREGFRVTMLPRKWQVFTYDVRPEDFKSSLVLHYAGNTPWAPVTMITDAEVLWYRAYAFAFGVDCETAIRQVHTSARYLLGRMLFYFFANPLGQTVVPFLFLLIGLRRRAEEIIRLARPLPMH